MSEKRFLLPLAIFTALKAGVEAHGGKIGTGQLFNYDDSPRCILGHACVIDGVSPQDAGRIVYGEPDDGFDRGRPAERPVTPILQALWDAGINWQVNDRGIVSGRVTFDEWCERVGVGIAEEVAHV